MRGPPGMSGKTKGLASQSAQRQVVLDDGGDFLITAVNPQTPETRNGQDNQQKENCWPVAGSGRSSRVKVHVALASAGNRRLPIIRS